MEIPLPIVRHLTARYADAAAAIVRLTHDRPELQAPLDRIPDGLADLPLALSEDGQSLVYTFDTQADDTGIAPLLRRLHDQGIDFKDLHSSESSLEDIFVSLVRAPA